MKRFALLIFSLILFGCTQINTSRPIEPVRRTVTIPESAKAGVDAVGGETAWNNTQAILAGATAKFYKPDGTVYVTQQRHVIYPWSDSIRIYDAEPQGCFLWQLTGNEFVLLAGNRENECDLPIELSDEDIARAIWSLLAAPATIATETSADINLGEPARFEGVWHYPLVLSGSQFLYMNRDDNHFDIFTISTQKSAILMARAYDYRTIEKTGIAVPSKIEIFRADSLTAQPHKIIEFDYHKLESVCF